MSSVGILLRYKIISCLKRLELALEYYDGGFWCSTLSLLTVVAEPQHCTNTDIQILTPELSPLLAAQKIVVLYRSKLLIVYQTPSGLMFFLASETSRNLGLQSPRESLRCLTSFCFLKRTHVGLKRPRYSIQKWQANCYFLQPPPYFFLSC